MNWKEKFSNFGEIYILPPGATKVVGVFDKYYSNILGQEIGAKCNTEGIKIFIQKEIIEKLIKDVKSKDVPHGEYIAEFLKYKWLGK